MEMTREQLNAKRAVSRRNAKIRTNNAKSIELKQSENDIKNASKSFASSVKELLVAVFAVIKFVARDCWADFGKFMQLIARKMNRAGNHMDWSDK